MKFTVTPASLLLLLKQVGKGQSKHKNSLVTFSAARDRIEIIFKGMSAGMKTPVSGRGQFQINWKTITQLLSRYPPSTHINIICSGERLLIDTFSMPVQNYQSEPVTEKAPLTPAKPGRQSKKPETAPQSQSSADGYSPTPPYRDDNDVTGVAGMISATDFTGPREPVTCPVCKHVGYCEKRIFKGVTYYSYRRSWVTASEALNRVVLTGAEETLLCPECHETRLHTNKNMTPITGSQTDLFDKL